MYIEKCIFISWYHKYNTWEYPYVFLSLVSQNRCYKTVDRVSDIEIQMLNNVSKVKIYKNIIEIILYWISSTLAITKWNFEILNRTTQKQITGIIPTTINYQRIDCNRAYLYKRIFYWLTKATLHRECIVCNYKYQSIFSHSYLLEHQYVAAWYW